MHRLWAFVATALLLQGCPDDRPTSSSAPPRDAGRQDSGGQDAHTSDAAELDGATADGGAKDSGARDADVDAGAPDGHARDADVDVGAPDSGAPDAGPADSGAADAGPLPVTCTEAGLVTRTISDSASVGTPDTYFFDVNPGDPFCAEITGGGSGRWGLTVSNGTSTGIYCSNVTPCRIRVGANDPTLLVTALTTDIGSYTLTVRSIPR